MVRRITLERYSRSGKAVKVDGRAVAFASACHDSTALLACFALPVFAAKAAAAMVRGGNEFGVTVESMGRSVRHESGYRVAIGRLPGYNTAQVLMLANEPSLLIGDIDEALWRYLMSESITTPLLREWLPQVRDALESHSKIMGTNSFGCDVHVARFGSEDVDRAVSRLVKQRKVVV